MQRRIVQMTGPMVRRMTGMPMPDDLAGRRHAAHRAVRAPAPAGERPHRVARSWCQNECDWLPLPLPRASRGVLSRWCSSRCSADVRAAPGAAPCFHTRPNDVGFQVASL
jgi:hypothetical protein